MRKASCDFSCMVPTINFNENIISQLITASRQKKFDQLVLIAQVRLNNSKVEFHCSTLITDPDSEINIREDEVPIFLKILSDSEYKQPVSNEIEAMKEAFYEMIEETSNQYNANNIYSLISDVAYINNQLNARISLFCPKSSIEIEEIGTSDAPTVCSIPGATYRFPKDKKFRDPNCIYAIYYGINGIKDPRIYSLSYSIYLQQHKKITAAFNNKLYRITFHENDEFELLSTTFCISKPSSITARFNLIKTPTSKHEQEQLGYLNENMNMNMNLNLNSKSNREPIETKTIVTLPREFYDNINEMKNELSELREEIQAQEERINSRISQHDEEIKTLLQAILTEVTKKSSNQEKSSKIFSHRQISRKPVIPLEIALTSSYEIQQSPAEFLQQQIQPQSQPLPQYQPAQQIQQKQRQVSHSRSENINPQVQPQANITQNQNIGQNKSFPMNSIEQIPQPERQYPKYSINMQSSFEKRKSITKDPMNTSTSTSTTLTNKRSSQNSTIHTSTNISSTNNNNNNNSISNKAYNNNVFTTTTNTSNNNNNNSKVNLSNVKYMSNINSNSSSRKTKTSLSIENRPDNDDISTKYSKQSSKFTSQLFNEPSFDISTNLPDSFAESPSKGEKPNIQSDLSFILNNEESMDTNKFYQVIGMSNPNNS